MPFNDIKCTELFQFIENKHNSLGDWEKVRDFEIEM